MLRVLALLAAVLVVESCALDFSGYREGNRDGGAGGTGSGGGGAGRAGASGSSGGGGANCNPLAPQASDTTHSACPLYQTCMPSNSGATSCVKSGGGTSGSLCKTGADCVPGLGCVKAISQCADYCLTDGDCTDGGYCSGVFSPALFEGSTELRYCE